MRSRLARMAALAAAMAWALAARAEAQIRWAPSFPLAMARARTSGRLVMVSFHTDWCTLCKRLRQEVFPDRRVVQLSSQFVPVRVNGEKEGAALVRRYKVRGYPTILFINAQGEVEGKIGGYLPPEGFAQQMALIAEAHREFPALRARLAANPRDAEAAARLTVIYAARGDRDRALELLRTAARHESARRAFLLGRAYNAVGDACQEVHEFEEAIGFFRKAVAAARDPYEAAYAQLSIGVCRMQQGRWKDALPELEAVLAIPNVPGELRRQAEDYLVLAKKRGDGPERTYRQ